MLIDASVHPSVRRGDDLREYMEMPFKKRVFSPVHRYAYSSPKSEYHEPARPADGLPGSDVGLTEEQLFERAGVDRAILVPLTRGMNMDSSVSSAVCGATNLWLADTWLGSANDHGRFKGTIRVNPRDADHAVDEIARWADHPHMVQVGVPMAALGPYGEPSYFRIWQAAAAAHLPVVVHLDGGSGIEFPSSPVGNFRLHVEYSAFGSYSFAYHLASLIMHGVFDRLEDLVFVFGDGGIDLAMPMVWRLIADWRSGTDDHPWARQSPPSYLRDHVRFVSSRMEGPPRPEQQARWIELTDAEHLLLYGSSYPLWSYAPPSSLALEDGPRERILGANAAAIYRGLSTDAPVEEGTVA
jgi:predicted TIM-barrel fold metal-dependent hydrolase